MGFEEYFARFISSLLYSYSEELDKSNIESLSISISRNSLSTKLKDIIVYRNSFLQHGLPFFVRFGLISNISMKLSLKESNQFEINDIFFYLRFIDSKKFPTVEELNEMRDHQLYAHELFKDKVSYIMNKYLLSNFNEQIKNIIMYSFVSISNIYFCIELNDSIVSIFIDHIQLIGNRIQPKAKTDNNNMNEELQMKMSIIGLKVFMIQKNKQENHDFFIEDDNNFIQNMKQFFDKLIHVNNDDDTKITKDCIIDIDEIDAVIRYDSQKNLKISINNEQKIEDTINLSLWQINSLAKILPDFIKFRKYFLTKHIRRPTFLLKKINKNENNQNNNENNNNSNSNNNNDNNNNNNDKSNNNNSNNININGNSFDNNYNNGVEIDDRTKNNIRMSEAVGDVDVEEDGSDDDDVSGAWLFAHRCAIEINRDRSSSENSANPILGQFIPSFIKRSQYLKIWQSFKNKPFNPILLNRLDHTLTYHQITLFRYMAELMRKKWSRKPLTREDVYKALEFVEMDLPNLIIFFLKRSFVGITFSKVITNLHLYEKNDNDYYLSLSLLNPNISMFIDDFESLNFGFNFSSFKLKDCENNKIIESVENGTQGFNFSAAFFSQAYRVHNNFMNKKIKDPNDNSILDDLTIMKINATIKNEVFVMSKNEFFNFLNKIDLEEIFSILFSNEEAVDDLKSRLELSALFDISQDSPLCSLFEKIDIDFNMDNCQLSFLLNDPFQLTFVYDKLLIQRQQQQLELENKQQSINAKSKLTGNVRKIFRKSDLIFDMTNASLIFGNSNIEKILTTEISIHTIFMISQKKILVFISPLFFQSNWNEIKELKGVFSELLKIFDEIESSPIKKSSFKLPKLFGEIEIIGGIPTITLSLDLPSSQHKLLTFVIDTVQFGGFLEDFNLKATVNKVTFEDLLEINNVSFDLKTKHLITEKVTFLMMKMLAILPRDVMSLIELTPLTANFSFLMKTLSVDLSFDWIEEPIDYTVTNFSGYCDSSKDDLIHLKCFVNCINLCHKPLIKNQDVTGTIGLLKTINIYVDFGDLELIFLHEIFGLAFNNRWKIKEVFPVDFVLDWSIKADSILIEDLVYCENALIYIQMSDCAFGGDVMIESLEIVYVNLKKKDPISISFDLTRHYFSAALNFDYIEIDFYRITSLLQYFLHFPFHITEPLTLDVRIMPTTIGLQFDLTGKNVIHPTLSIYDNIDEEPNMNSNTNLNEESEMSFERDDMLFINLRSSLYFDGSKVSISMEMNDFEIYYGNERFLTIPYIEVYGDSQWQMSIPLIDCDFSSLQLIEKLMKIANSLPHLSLNLWNIQHSLVDILTQFKISTVRCLLLNKSVQFGVNQIFASFLNYELNMKCSVSTFLYSTWFARSEILRIDEVKFQCLFNNDDKLFDAKMLINSPVSFWFDNESFNCLKSIFDDKKEFLTIINKTDHCFTTKFGKISEKSTFSFHDFFDDEDFELTFSHGTIPIKRENFDNKGEMKVIFEHLEDELLLYLNEKNQLKITYVFTIVNKTETDFKIEYKFKKYQVKSKSVIHKLPVISGTFKINGQIVNSSCLLNNVYFVKVTKRSIVIQPEYYIINECPFDIKINRVSYKRYSKSEFTLNIANNPNATVESILFPAQTINISEVKVKKFISYKLKSVYDFDLPFVLRVQVIEKVDSESVKTLIFSPSTIIKSKIQNLLISPDKINCFPLTCDNDFAFSPHKKFISRVFLTTSEEFGFSEIILNEKENHKNEDELIVLYSINDERVAYPFTLKRSIKKYPYYNIEILTVSPYITVKNDTGCNLMIYLPNSKNFLIEKDKIKELNEIESSFNFNFSVEEPLNSKKIKSQQSKPQLFNLSFSSKASTNSLINSNNNSNRSFYFNFNDICSQKVVAAGFFMPIEVSVKNKKRSVSKMITFSFAKTFPCRFVNLSNYTLKIESKEFKPKTAYLYAPSHRMHATPIAQSFKLNSQNKSISFTNDPFSISQIGIQKLICEEIAQDENEADNLDLRKELFYIEEHKLASGSMIREIVVSDSLDEIEKYKFGFLNGHSKIERTQSDIENEESKIGFAIEAFMNDVTFSLFEQSPEMALSLHIKTVRFLVNQTSSSSLIENESLDVDLNQFFLSLGTIEVRNFNRQLVVGTKERHEFMKLSVKNLFSPFHIQEIDFSIKPFYFKFDLSFLTFFASLFLNDQNLNGKIRYCIKDDENGIDYSNGLDLLNNFLNDGLIEKVKIDPISIWFSFEVGQKISPYFPQFLRIIPSAKPYHIDIKKIEIEEIDLQKKLFKNADSELKTRRSKVTFVIKNVTKFIFSLNIFGSPYSLLERQFFQKFGCFSIFSFVFGFLENITDYIRCVCHFFGGQENLRLKDPKSPIIWGFTSLFMSVFNGLGVFIHCLLADKNPLKAVWKSAFCGAGGVFDALCGIFMFIRSLFADDFDIEKELQYDDE